MNWQRITVFRHPPDPQVLAQRLRQPCRLFYSVSANAYFIEPVSKYNDKQPQLGGYYDSMFVVDGQFDLSELESFKRQNAKHKEWFHIHDEIVKEAIWLSRVFHTEVLSSYSNDEHDDFVAVAKDGVLTHLRFVGYRKNLGQLSPSEIKAIKPDIRAQRIAFPDEQVIDDPICKYQEYEGVKSPGSALQWSAYRLYVEGEHNGEALYQSLDSCDDEVPTDLMFRAANVEFKALFGVIIPDPYYDKDDFALIDEYSTSLSRTLKGRLSSLVRLLISFPLAIGLMLWGSLTWHLRRKWYKLFIIFAVLTVLYLLGKFGPKPVPELSDFDTYCQAFGGTLHTRDNYQSMTGNEVCNTPEQSFLEHDLPGQLGEIRRIAGVLETKRCKDSDESLCLYFNGALLSSTLIDFELVEGGRKIVALRREQTCNYVNSSRCEDGSDLFVFTIGVAFDYSEKVEP